MINLILPYPPSSNRYWRADRGGRPHLTDEARSYKRLVKKALDARGLSPLQGTVGVRLFVYRPRKAGDLDNRFKVALDALNKAAWNDDSQVIEIHGYRRDDKENPRIEVAVWTVAPAHIQETML